ncbi:hypothetical protein OH77DRAFT_948269 [Trametes cingulata]|nr:hypothetical protein OH77DRAFT_948269 [Trametes cingulata]
MAPASSQKGAYVLWVRARLSIVCGGRLVPLIQLVRGVGISGRSHGIWPAVACRLSVLAAHSVYSSSTSSLRQMQERTPNPDWALKSQNSTYLRTLGAQRHSNNGLPLFMIRARPARLRVGAITTHTQPPMHASLSSCEQAGMAGVASVCIICVCVDADRSSTSDGVGADVLGSL